MVAVVNQQYVKPGTYTLTTTAATSNDVWFYWNAPDPDGLTGLVSSSTTSDGLLWRVWNTNAPRVYQITIDTAPTWVSWNEEPERQERVAEFRRLLRQPSPEELEERRRQEEIAQRAREEAAAKQRAAVERAEKLLQSCLTPVQRDCLEKRGFFYVTGADGNVYRIKRGTHGNVEKVDPTSLDRALERYCVQPDGVPTADSMLAQKLALECHPEAFFSVANRTVLVPA